MGWEKAWPAVKESYWSSNRDSWRGAFRSSCDMRSWIVCILSSMAAISCAVLSSSSAMSFFFFMHFHRNHHPAFGKKDGDFNDKMQTAVSVGLGMMDVIIDALD